MLKNAIDWVSRYEPQPFNERNALLLSASPSMIGGNRGLWALRVPLEHLGARVYPDMFSLAQAHKAFDPQGRLSDPRLERALRHQHRQLHGPRRGLKALSVRSKARLGRVPGGSVPNRRSTVSSEGAYTGRREGASRRRLSRFWSRLVATCER